MFYGTDDNIINVQYYDNGDDPDNEIIDGCNLPAYTVSYAGSYASEVSWSIDGNFKEDLGADECFGLSNYSDEVEPGDVLKVSVSVNDGEDQVTDSYSVVIEEPPEE